jgi:hypothetical protein
LNNDNGLRTGRFRQILSAKSSANLGAHKVEEVPRRPSYSVIRRQGNSTGLAAATSRLVKPPRVADTPAALECTLLLALPLNDLDGGLTGNAAHGFEMLRTAL